MISRFSLLIVYVFVARISLAESPTLAMPQFVVPGQEQTMGRLNEMFRLHYPHAFTNCTLWDAWLPHGTLWPAVGEPASAKLVRRKYRDVFLQRRIDSEGYVSMQQHRGMAHSEGWPFPAYQQSTGRGWHFSTTHEAWAIQHFRLKALTNTEGWNIEGAEVVSIDEGRGLVLRCTSNQVRLTTPSFSCGTIVAPFVRLEWAAKGVPSHAKASIGWKLNDEAEWLAERRAEFPFVSSDDRLQFSNVPLYRQPGYAGLLNQYQLVLEECEGATITLKSLITAIDTRHPITNLNFLRGSAEYFAWTKDREFLAANVSRLRASLRFALDEFQVREQKHIVVPWVGHDGRSGLVREVSGKKRMRPGLGVGNNYWDLLPFGGHDALATIYLLDALAKMSELESAIDAHPEWSIATAEPLQSAAALKGLADEVRAFAQQEFWSQERGRFIGWIDAAGERYDYGFTFLNLEAIHYGLASREQAELIMDWIEGEREVEEDTSRGKDIYHWRFGPRATTRRNIDTYAWVWNAPEAIEWGNQVQDGGAVLGFSYFDLMARLKTRGADNTWHRLQEIIAWFDEVQSAGGYRAYYAIPGRGTLQGGGPPGGLGMDHEFMESVLLPQVMLYGFMGFKPTAEGFTVHPRLPKDWPSLTINRIHIHDRVLTIKANSDGTYEVKDDVQ